MWENIECKGLGLLRIEELKKRCIRLILGETHLILSYKFNYNYNNLLICYLLVVLVAGAHFCFIFRFLGFKGDEERLTLRR